MKFECSDFRLSITSDAMNWKLSGFLLEVSCVRWRLHMFRASASQLFVFFPMALLLLALTRFELQLQSFSASRFRELRLQDFMALRLLALTRFELRLDSFSASRLGELRLQDFLALRLLALTRFTASLFHGL